MPRDYVAKALLEDVGSIGLLPIHKSGVLPDCHRLDADLVPSKISTIVLGEHRPSRLPVWGAVIF